MPELLKAPLPRNVTKHPVIDPRGNVLYIEAGVADRYWKEVEEGKGNLVVTDRDVSGMLDERGLPKSKEARATLEKLIDPHRDEIKRRKGDAVKHDEEAQPKSTRPARKEDVMHGVLKIAESMSANAGAGVNAEVLAELRAMRAENQAMREKVAELEKASAKKAKPEPEAK